MPLADERDRLQVALDVVGQLGHHLARDGERADRPHAEGVAVRRALRHRVDADGERATGPVLDHDRLPERARELRGEQPRHVVGGAAGRLRNDQLERPVRELLRGRAERGAREERGEKSPHRRGRKTSP
jgi:hypothetical protein